MIRYWIRKTHRYLGIFIGIQILLWTVSGIYFVWNDLDVVRGENLKATIEIPDLRNADLYAVGELLAGEAMNQLPADKVQNVQLRTMLGRPVYELQFLDDENFRYALFDASSGELLSPIAPETARLLAQQDFVPEADISNITLIETAGPHDEFRGRDLPVYRVEFEHETETRIYVSASRGIVTARRNSVWRIFDFLWMLHTMDFEARDDFNNTLVKIVSLFALATILGGFLLWGFTSPRVRKLVGR